MKKHMITLTLLTWAAVVGCSKQKPATNPTPPATESPGPSAQKEEPKVTDDVKVSPNIALGNDIVALCGIKPSDSINPSFEYDKDELLAEDRAILDQLAVCLMTGPLKDKGVSLIGRADPRGTDEYNLGLGSRRSNSVSAYLERLGVKKAQLSPTTRGSLDATGADEAGWAQDRRVDIQLAPAS